MKQYLRLKELPENEQSYNFVEKTLENGVSVFDIVDDKPVLSNLQLITSFESREHDQAYVVTGDKIGTGFDGEPLLKNVSIVKKIELDFKALTFNAFRENFTKVEKSSEELPGIARVYHEVFLNKKTGEIAEMRLSNLTIWEELPEEGYWTYDYDGYTFSEPTNDFDIRLGFKRRGTENESI